MIVCSCFDGDEMDLARAQHDLYFGIRPWPDGDVYISTLGLWWYVVLTQARERRARIPWFDGNASRLQKLNGFNHKLLQRPHEHLAAHYRWQRRNMAAPALRETDPKSYRAALSAQWWTYFSAEIHALMQDDDALVATAKIILYSHFDASDQAAGTLDELLVNRYGLECVANTARASDTRLVEAARRRAGQNVYKREETDA